MMVILPKVSTTHRILAKLIDFSIIILMIVLLPYPVGGLLGLIYILMKDSLWHGQSIGKKICKLHVIHTDTKSKISVRESSLRNAPLGVVTFFGMVPMWGWILFFLVGLPIAALEIYLMLKMQNGQRLGDVMADTIVQEFKG